MEKDIVAIADSLTELQEVFMKIDLYEEGYTTAGGDIKDQMQKLFISGLNKVKDIESQCIDIGFEFDSFTVNVGFPPSISINFKKLN